MRLPGRAFGPRRPTAPAAASALHPRRRSCCSASARPSASSSQLLVLLPYLRAAGFRFRPRFDFRGTGLGHTLRLGVWTVLFVVVNQVAYTVVVRLASGGTAERLRRPAGAGRHGTGYTVYAAAFLFVMVPHAIITVSLATAILPRLSAKAADGDLRGAGRHPGRHAAHRAGADRDPVRAAAAAGRLRPGEGALRLRRRPATTFDHYVAVDDPVRPGLVFFTVHYLMLRGFYALERTARSSSSSAAIAATNIVVGGRARSRATDRRAHLPGAGRWPTPASYLVGSAVSYLLLRAPARRPRDRRAGALPGPAAASRPASRPRAAWAARRRCCRAAGTTPRT